MFSKACSLSKGDLPHLSSIVFTTPSVPLVGDRNPCGRVLTQVPKPYAPTIGARDVAGCAPSPPEFWYRQRSLCPQGVADEFLTQKNCDFLAMLYRLAEGLLDNIPLRIVKKRKKSIKLFVRLH